MLKSKRVKAHFLGHGLLLIVPGTTMMKGSTPSLTRMEVSKNVVPFTGGLKDSTIAKSKDSSASFTAAMVPPATEKAPESLHMVRLNKRAQPYLKKYVSSEAESLAEIRQRSATYFRIIDTVFSKYHLPLELKYLAVIESQLRPDACSHVGAKGAWQFMPTTARDLGLKVNRKQDERRYFYKSTVAAAKYLKDLYAQFGDWLLVIAAYNSGPGPILNAIHKTGSKNFWVLQHYLPAESRCHVKRFIGAHYYFEGAGSETTCTRAEAVVYKSPDNISK